MRSPDRGRASARLRSNSSRSGEGEAGRRHKSRSISFPQSAESCRTSPIAHLPPLASLHAVVVIFSIEVVLVLFIIRVALHYSSPDSLAPSQTDGIPSQGLLERGWAKGGNVATAGMVVYLWGH